MFATGEDGQVHFAEALALTPEDLATVQQDVRTRVLRWFARAGPLDPADAQAHDALAPRRGLVVTAASLNADKAGVNLH